MSDGAVDHLTAAARLFGRLLLREFDTATLEELRQDDVRLALAELDVAEPGDAELPALGQRFFELFLHPDGALPPVQSLWHNGQYDGDPAAGVRRVAEAANLSMTDNARGAAPWGRARPATGGGACLITQELVEALSMAGCLDGTQSERAAEVHSQKEHGARASLKEPCA